MLFCKKCQVEYEGDSKFCGQCGSLLIRKEEASLDFENIEKPLEEKPKEKFICPDCKIIYEKTKSCIRCGVEVVLLSSVQEKERTDTVQEPQAGNESPQVLTTKEWAESVHQHLVCPVCKKDHLGGKSCIRCGAELVSSDLLQKEEKIRQPRPLEPKKPDSKTPSLSDSKEDLFQDEALDQQAPNRTVEEQIKKGKIARKFRKDYPRIFLNWAGIAIICMAVGYLLWSSYLYIGTTKPVGTPLPPPKGTIASLSSPFSASLAPSLSSTEAEERENIRNLLEMIRRANLSKDIDLFLSCYSKDFKDLQDKKETTLESWGNFNFLDLTFDLRSPSVSGNIASASVEWLIRFSPKGGGQPQESKTILDVVFKKEDGAWKIEEIKSSL